MQEVNIRKRIEFLKTLEDLSLQDRIESLKSQGWEARTGHIAEESDIEGVIDSDQTKWVIVKKDSSKIKIFRFSPINGEVYINNLISNNQVLGWGSSEEDAWEHCFYLLGS